MAGGMINSVNISVTLSGSEDISRLPKFIKEVTEILSSTGENPGLTERMGTMTNFEHMRETVLNRVVAMDQEELWQLVTDTCMNEGNSTAIFSCGVCEEIFGDCDTMPGGNGCTKKYLDWCDREYKAPGWEDKAEIVDRLQNLLKATRAGSDIDRLVLGGDRKAVTIRRRDGSERCVNIEADSGYAIIKDVMNAL